MYCTFEDLTTLARTVYGEARGESAAGRQAVAHVILNRVLDPRWPDTIHQVCTQRWQFSCWNDSDPNRPKLLTVSPITPTMQTILRECLRVLYGEIPDQTGGSNHYLTIKLAESRPPRWYDKNHVKVDIGNHRFLRM